MTEQAACCWRGEDVILRVRVQPRAAKDEILGWQGGALKIRLTAPPVDGKANARLIALLAAELKVPKSRIVLLSGQSGRDKRLKIQAPRVTPDWLNQA